MHNENFVTKIYIRKLRAASVRNAIANLFQTDTDKSYHLQFRQEIRDRDKGSRCTRARDISYELSYPPGRRVIVCENLVAYAFVMEMSVCIAIDSWQK